MKTVRQIADELGVSKQSVYKRYKGKLYTEVHPYAHTEQGVLYISEQGENLIKQDFLKDTASNGAHTDTVIVDAKYLAHIEAEIEFLRGELTRTREALQAGQALHAGTIRQQLAPGSSGTEKPAEPSKFKGWVSRVFRKEQ